MKLVNFLIYFRFKVSGSRVDLDIDMPIGKCVSEMRKMTASRKTQPTLKRFAFGNAT